MNNYYKILCLLAILCLGSCGIFEKGCKCPKISKYQSESGARNKKPW